MVFLLIQRVTAPDRNTILPHPSADTSPQASLEAADIIIERSISRLLEYSRKRNHKSKNKRQRHAECGRSAIDKGGAGV
ncbi:hypothetical protein ACLOAV_010389 [Pseudogymnoascus australis]